MTEKEAILQSIASRLPDYIYSEELDMEFAIWTNQEMVELNELHETESLLPGYYGLGSFEGEQLLAIDMKSGVFYALPFTNLKKSEKKVVADSFKTLMTMAT